jgi:hypothetical protein
MNLASSAETADASSLGRIHKRNIQHHADADESGVAFSLFLKLRAGANTQFLSVISHPPRLGHPNYTWQRVQIMKLFVMQFPSPKLE